MIAKYERKIEALKSLIEGERGSSTGMLELEAFVSLEELQEPFS